MATRSNHYCLVTDFYGVGCHLKRKNAPCKKIASILLHFLAQLINLHSALDYVIAHDMDELSNLFRKKNEKHRSLKMHYTLVRMSRTCRLKWKIWQIEKKMRIYERLFVTRKDWKEGSVFSCKFTRNSELFSYEDTWKHLCPQIWISRFTEQCLEVWKKNYDGSLEGVTMN